MKKVLTTSIVIITILLTAVDMLLMPSVVKVGKWISKLF